MAEPFYAPHQLAELQEGNCAVSFATRHTEALHRHQHRAADDRRVGGLADVERALIRIRTGERRAPRRKGKISAEMPKLTPVAANPSQHCDKGRIQPGDARTYDVVQSTISRLTA